MKVIITGATGFLGSHLVKSLLSEGHEIIILKRSTSDTRRITEILPFISTYDLDQAGLEQPFRDHGYIDAVFHTATCYGRNGESVTDVFQTNMRFPLMLLESAALFNTKTFFNTDTFINTEPLRYRYLENYALSKKQFVEWGKRFAGMGKIRFVNIKLQHLYGPGDNDWKFTTSVIRKCVEHAKELKLTQGEQERDFVFIDDVAAAYLLLLLKAPEVQKSYEEYEVGSGKAITIRKFVQTVHRITKSKTILRFGELPYRENEIMHSQANIDSLKGLGWVPKVALEEGIREILLKDLGPAGVVS